LHNLASGARPRGRKRQATISTSTLRSSSRQDLDERRILIEAEHPELHRALESDRHEIHLGGETLNPTPHIAMHEVVANQLSADNPPDVERTAQRLVAAGYERRPSTTCTRQSSAHPPFSSGLRERGRVGMVVSVASILCELRSRRSSPALVPLRVPDDFWQIVRGGVLWPARRS
jgi:hypothetical protein